MPKGDHYVWQRSGAPKLPGASKKMGASWVAVPGDGAGLADAQLANEAVRRLERLKAGGAPFLLAVGFLRPHLPFVAPQHCYDRFDPAALPVFPLDAALPTGAPAFAGHTAGELRAYTDIPEVGQVDAARARELVHGYYASVAWVDHQIGVLMQGLDRLGLRDNTIVVVWGDHGFHLGDHGLWCKHTNFEQATRNPLLISGPGVAAGRPSDSLAQSIDLGPTLLARAGVAVPATMSGRDLAPILTDPAATVNATVTHCYPRRDGEGWAVLARAVRFRLVSWQVQADGAVVARELYDLEADPSETANLIERPEHAAVIARLEAVLAAQGGGQAAVRSRGAPTLNDAFSGWNTW